jgi:endonuclease III-like uncharacterized protein
MGFFQQKALRIKIVAQYIIKFWENKENMDHKVKAKTLNVAESDILKFAVI